MSAFGTASDRIRHGLAGNPEFDRWASGLVDRETYAATLDAVLAWEPAFPLTENECALSARLHWRPGDVVAAALHDCVARGILPAAGYDVAAFADLRELVAAKWDHAGRKTFIFPEEAQLLYAVADIARPRTIACLGSYYGYWAVWAIAAASPALERVVLLDVDPDVTALAAANLRALALDARVEVLQRDAIAFMDEAEAGSYDLMVLDAEGPKTGPDERLLGKRIYEPIMATALPRLRPGGLVVTHNILLDHTVDHPYFRDHVAHNEVELGPFLDVITPACAAYVHVETTEGVGIYRKAP